MEIKLSIDNVKLKNWLRTNLDSLSENDLNTICYGAKLCIQADIPTYDPSLLEFAKNNLSN